MEVHRPPNDTNEEAEDWNDNSRRSSAPRRASERRDEEPAIANSLKITLIGGADIEIASVQVALLSVRSYTIIPASPSARSAASRSATSWNQTMNPLLLCQEMVASSTA